MTPCALCPRNRPIIAPDGPPNAKIMFVGEMPGKEENSRGRPFVGHSGKEFNSHYLPLAGLDRDDVWVTNTIKCFGGDSDDQELRDECARHHLAGEVIRLKPQVIVPMGAVACSLVGLDLYMQNGIPVEGIDWFGCSPVTFPVGHPAAGLHDGTAMVGLRQNFEDLGKLLRGQLEVPVDECPSPFYMELETASEVASAMGGQFDPMASDTEFLPRDLGHNRLKDEMYCLSFSFRPGTGFMIRKSNTKALAEFRKWLNWSRGKILFHNAMADIPVYAESDLFFNPRRLDDTMVRAYHLQNVPQGLKALAYRLCGMVMREFDDVVGPYSRQLIVEYFHKLAEVQWPVPEPYMRDDKKGGQKLYKPQGLDRKVKRALLDYSKDAATDFSKRWNTWSDEEKAPAIDQFGFLPKALISMVPTDELVDYSCRDSDATFRVWLKLKKRAIEFSRSYHHAYTM